MKSYMNLLDLRQTERAILLLKHHFQTELANALNLTRVSAPLLVQAGTGVNDDLNGVEKPVSFPVKDLGGANVEIVQSLAKWKRMALADYGFEQSEGLYTDMNALRPDETLDELHSVYVDQWDWERVMKTEERNISFLKEIVEKIWKALRNTEKYLHEQYSALKPVLQKKIKFVHATKLQEIYPSLAPKEREDAICREHGAVFVIGIGAPLANGLPHDGRAPDYDDWSTDTELGPGLNGDILVWNQVLERAYEVSSMGIRVNPKALTRQLKAAGTEGRADLLFHRRLLAGELPQTIGGGIGQSRLCMLMLRKRHIGEVQCGVWPSEMLERLKGENTRLL